MQILYHFPDSETQCFKKQYEALAWRNSPQELERFKSGMTGYPLIDAGIRELLSTGHMHNRVRMLVASFLTKNLLIYWKEGERFFAEHLLDFELASNVGNWQWAAGCGCDAAPFFRIFNPELQTQKFDPDLNYVKQWVPELGSSKYPAAMVSFAETRKRALAAFARLKEK